MREFKGNGQSRVFHFFLRDEQKSQSESMGAAFESRCYLVQAEIISRPILL